MMKSPAIGGGGSTYASWSTSRYTALNNIDTPPMSGQSSKPEWLQVEHMMRPSGSYDQRIGVLCGLRSTSGVRPPVEVACVSRLASAGTSELPEEDDDEPPQRSGFKFTIMMEKKPPDL